MRYRIPVVSAWVAAPLFVWAASCAARGQWMAALILALVSYGVFWVCGVLQAVWVLWRFHVRDRRLMAEIRVALAELAAATEARKGGDR